MTTEYTRRLTVICPENLLDRANAWITCVFSLSLDDLSSFSQARQVHLPSQKKYCTASGVCTQEMMDRAEQGTDLQRPARLDPEGQIDMTKANLARQDVIVYEPVYDANGDLTNPLDSLFPLTKILVVKDTLPRMVLAYAGLTNIPAQE